MVPQFTPMPDSTTKAEPFSTTTTRYSKRGAKPNWVSAIFIESNFHVENEASSSLEMVPPNLVSQLRTVSHSIARTCRRHYSNGGSKPHNSFASTAQVEEASRILRTFVQALDLRHDKAMQAKLVKQALLSFLYLRNYLLNMYAKCSHLPDALKLFYEMTHKNVVSWTVVIAGFFQKGHP
ncbi:hypothetical protein RJ639_017243 [Escallonia herrerae]|uniref:Pentatricopeptide repeat-containing protein n=1 Tax=Escallonia herrerae TaxID=1293975 RepID=A0AA88VFY2_9ASTE|nr:hypothetical protein RJ639_017243 [Escallonia herrerae]